MRRTLVLILALALAACASATPAPSGPTPVPSMTDFVIPTASPKPSPTAYAGQYGFLVWTPSGYLVRREGSASPLGTIDLDPIAVAPDGRYVAGWTRSRTELQIRDVRAPGALVRSARIADGERGAALTWSVDESGLLYSVNGATWSALRTLDVASATSAPRELLRVDGVDLRPVVWDRLGGDLVSAFVVEGGSATEYVLIRGVDSPVRRTLPAKRWQERPAVSGDGQFVVLAAQAEPLLRTFMSDDPSFVLETHGQNATTGAAAIGRPMSAQLGVVLDREFYLWDPTGPREPFSTEPIFGLVCFRFDGSAAVVRSQTGLKLLDVRTKTLTPLDDDVRYGIALP